MEQALSSQNGFFERHFGANAKLQRHSSDDHKHTIAGIYSCSRDELRLTCSMGPRTKKIQYHRRLECLIRATDYAAWGIDILRI